MFYLALFPQFIDAGRGSVLVQGLVLGFLRDHRHRRSW